MVAKPDWLDAMSDKCGSVADTAGDIAGDAYGAGALAVTENAGFAKMVNEIIDHQVDNGWNDMCHLPQNLGIFDQPDSGDSVTSDPSVGDAGGGDTGGDTGDDTGGGYSIDDF